MASLELAPTHRPVRAYYEALEEFHKLGVSHEGAVRDAFGTLLKHCAKQVRWTLVNEFAIRRKGRRPGHVDGALLDDFRLARAYWEAKDSEDDLPREVKKKIDEGYPTDNIVFQAPDHAILYQGGHRVLDEDITSGEALVEVVTELFRYKPPALDQWDRAVDEFRAKVPELAQALVTIIERERKENKPFVAAFGEFAELCRRAINPNIADQAVERMLVQHLLTERIFRKVFDHPDFAQRNVIAIEIEKVVRALTSRSFDRDAFLRNLDRFYGALEETAATIDDYGDKQSFLNTVYERFFQGFDARTADTHGIVYTPQPIVKFMVASVDEILQREFGRSLGDKGVHILDPFVGTGNFILQVMQQIPRMRLGNKYRAELHANEIMLLPYYIASMNIEHEYAELVGQYEPFDGLCLVDTFELAEKKQLGLAFFAEKNTERVQRQKASPIMVIVGNPPYNADQQNENDRNQNRKYKTIDARVAETYVKDSTARLRNKLGDPYVKAIRWASDRIGDEGIVALVTNHSYLHDGLFDGMRKHLGRDFDAVYLLDLGGNVGKNPKLSGTKNNVFGIKVGVAIAFLVRRRLKDPKAKRNAEIFGFATGEFWRKEEKFALLTKAGTAANIDWRPIQPDAAYNWFTEGLQKDFDSLMPLVSEKGADGSLTGVFAASTNGAKSNNDGYVYSFAKEPLVKRAMAMVDAYNAELMRWKALRKKPESIDEFLRVDEHELKWIRKTKRCLARGVKAKFQSNAIRRSLYRPFVAQYLFFDRMFNEDLYQLPKLFPSPETETRGFAVTCHSQSPFLVIASSLIPCVDVGGRPSQFVAYEKFSDDGATREDNVTDWCRDTFRSHYSDAKISKLDVFHYVYGVLHSPAYRERYAVNLRRKLPRIPFAPDFRAFVAAGRRLMDLHVGYEAQPEYPLRRIESTGEPLSWRAEKMRFTEDRTGIVYNDFLTLAGIPPDVFEFRLGNRSAIEWVVDQFKVVVDPRSEITNDPNSVDDPEQIIRLIERVVHVSVETVKIVRTLPPIDNSGASSSTDLRSAFVEAARKHLGEDPWARIAEAVADTLAVDANHEFTMPELARVAERHGFKLNDVHALVERLAVEPPGLLERLFLAADTDPPVAVPPDEVVRRLRESVDDPKRKKRTWTEWSKNVRVVWRKPSASA